MTLQFKLATEHVVLHVKYTKWVSCTRYKTRARLALCVSCRHSNYVASSQQTAAAALQDSTMTNDAVIQ